MTISSKDLYGQSRRALAEARNLYGQYENKQMPAFVADEIQRAVNDGNELRRKADGLREWESQPQYKHPMTPGADNGRGCSIDDTGHGSPERGKYDLPLAPEVKLREHLGYGRVSEDAVCGWLGHMVKSAVLPTDTAETVAWNRHIGVEQKDMTTLTVGAGGALVPTVVAAFLIDLLRSSVVTLAAGARVVPMSSKVVQVPRLAGDVTAAWLAETATVTASDATLEQVTLTAQRMEVGPVKISHELNEDSDPVGIGQVVARSIAAAAALKLDYAALRGSGTPPEPRGVRNQTGVTLYAPAANGDAMSYDLLLTLAKSVLQANAMPNAFVLTPGAEMTLASLKEATTNAYLQPPAALANVPRLTTTSLPINLTKGSGTALTEVYTGDWRQLMIGLRTGLSLQSMTELYRATGEIGIIARMRADVAVEHGPAFAVASFVDD